MFPHIEQIIMLEITECVEMETDEDGHYLGTAHRPLRFRCLRPSGSGIAIFDISLSYSLQKSSIIQKISVILSLVISIMIVFFVYNILIFNYKDTKNYRDYQLFKRISYPELRFICTQQAATGLSRPTLPMPTVNGINTLSAMWSSREALSR